jgi:hypothetical protein
MLTRLLLSCGVVVALAAGCSEQRDLAPTAPAPSITSITPVSGPIAGGTTITINGSGFVSGTTASVGGTAATGITLVSETQLTAVTPSGVAGPVDVVVSGPTALMATAVNGFTYLSGPAPNPTITRVDPTSGSAAGGTVITLTGSGFQTGVTVTLGGTLSGTVTLLTGGSLTFVAPAGAAGAAAIVVTNLDATTVTGTGFFTYGVPTPVVTVVNVNTGPVAGGTAITITGTGFESAGVSQPTVTIGGASATSVSAVNATTITCTTGAATVVGPQSVIVTNPNTNSGNLASGYSYVGPNPAPASLNPAIGPQAGGTTTTITGTNFFPGATVTVAGTAATVGAITPTTIVITTAVAANPNGPATVVVTNNDGNTGTLNNGFVFQGAAPTITLLSPNNGPSQGTNTVTITGTNFRTGVTVTIGGAPATITFSSLPTTLEVTAPIGTAGATTIVVTNTDLTTGSAGYTYNPAPAITSINPTNGTSGNAFTITGSNFITGATVLFGATNAGVVTVSATQITGTVPAGPGTGALTVTVTNPDAQTDTVGFTYNPAPTLTGLNPSGGALAGGGTVTLTGTGFISGASVSWNAGFITTTFVSATSLTVTAPAGSVGGVTVFVQNPDTQISGNQTYTYAAAPTLTSLNPTNGVQAGGGTVTLTGTGFVSGASVSWNAGFITTVFVSATSLTVTIPSGTGGVTVFVQNPDTQTSTNQTYTYNPAPTLTLLNPNNGPAVGLTTCTLTGTNFITGCTVSWNGGGITTAFVSATSFTVTIPAGTGGTSVTVFVTNPDLQTTGNLSYTYNLPPTITSLTPTSGPETGGNTVTIAGSAFSNPVTSVTFGASAAAITSENATQIIVTVPAGTPGAVTVTVTNSDGQTDTDTYTYDPAQTHVLTGPTDWQEQEREGIDFSAVPGSFQLALTEAGFASNGTRVTCLAYDANSAGRILVGTDSAGAFMSTNGGTSWTNWNAHSSPALPSNNVLCVNFFSGTAAPNNVGNVFIIGTDSGAALTHDSGGAFRIYNTSSSPRTPGARIEGADFFDQQAAPTHFLLASNSGTNLGGGGALWTTDGGNHFMELSATSKPLPLWGNYVRGVAYSPSSVNKFLIAGYAPDNPNFATASLQGGTGGAYLTTDGFQTYTRFSTVSSPSTPSQGCTSVAFDPTDTANGQIWAATFDGNAPKDSGSWSGGLWVTANDGVAATTYTTGSSPSISHNDVYHVAYGGVAGEFVVATEGGLDVTTDNATTFTPHTTATTVRIPDNFVSGCDMVSGGSASTGTIGAATGQKTVNSIAGGFSQSTDNFTSASALVALAAPSLLPHPNVRDVAVFSGNSAGTHLLAATGDGLAISINSGTTWTTWDTSTTPALPSNDVRAVAWYDSGSTPARYVVGTAAGIVVVNGIGGSPTFTTLNSGSGLISNDVTSVDYFSGSVSVTDTVIAGTNAGMSVVTSATGSATYNNRSTSTSPAIVGNTVRGVAFFHGQATATRIAVATSAGLSLTSNAFGSAPTNRTNMPSTNLSSVDFWDTATGSNAVLVGHAAGASVSTNAGAGWTNHSTSNGLPTNDVAAVAFFDAGSTAATFAIGCRSVIAFAGPPVQVTNGGLVLTSNGLIASPTFARRQTGTVPRLPCDEVSSFDYDESAAGGVRWIAGCFAIDATDPTGAVSPGGLVLENGNTFRSMGTLTILQIEGGVMPRGSATTPTWDSRRIRGAGFRIGSTNQFVVGSLFGAAATVDGGTSFAVANEATTPAFLSGVVLDTAIYGGDTNGTTWIAATPAGPYFTSNGGTSFLLRSGLPTNDVRGIEFHHGVAGLVAAATSQGLAVSVNNGSTWTVFNGGNGLQNDCRDVDFYDAGTTSGSIRVVVATSNGVYVTTNLTTGATPTATWTQRSNIGTNLAGNNVWAVRYEENAGSGANFWVGTWYAAGNQVGGVARTINHGTSFATVPAALQYLFVWDIDVLSSSTNDIVFGHQGGVTVTSNGGTGWTTHTFESSSGALPSSDVRRVGYGNAGGTWLAGTDDGLVITTNGGTNFGPFLRGTLSQFSYLSVTETIAGGTITYQVLDGNGALIPDGVLTGNSSGLTPTLGQIDLSAISVGTYPVIQIRVILTSATGAATPSVQDLTIVYKY